MRVKVVGAGLAGCEAARQLSRMGAVCELVEMKPERYSPAHSNPDFAELVCSNSLKSKDKLSASGLLKEEMRLLGSIVLEAAERTSVPAGGALAVDRDAFSAYITEAILKDPNIVVTRAEVREIDETVPTVIAAGPLASPALSDSIGKYLGEGYLSFFDAAAPVVSADSIDYAKAFFGDRYGRGTGDYLNCPMTKEEYDAFYSALITAETAEVKEFERQGVFEGCMPIEIMAGRGYETMRFGPMKPVGLPDPKTGKTAYAIVQLRKENRAGTMYNMVGFQTHLKFPEQKRVFGMIPALKNAEFLRYGVMHRNTFLNSPKILNEKFQVKNRPNLFFAGQITGVEGYMESAASGIAAGIHAARSVLGKPPVCFPPETAIGALSRHVSSPCADYQPMNVNYGIIKPLNIKIKDKKRKAELIYERSMESMAALLSELS